MVRFSPRSIASALVFSSVLVGAAWGCGGGSGQSAKEEKVDMSSLAPAGEERRDHRGLAATSRSVRRIEPEA